MHSNAPIAVVGMNKDLIDIQVALTLGLIDCAFPKFHDSRSVSNNVVLKIASEEVTPVQPGLKMLSRTRDIAGRAAFLRPKSRQLQD